MPPGAPVSNCNFWCASLRVTPLTASSTTDKYAKRGRQGFAVRRPQEISAATARQAAAALRRLPPEVRGRVCTLLAALGTDPQAVLQAPQPSPGEARKLLIAQALGRHLWAVVLDEPTNHLDLPSIERLQSALAAFPGALLVVTHDETFAAACGLKLRCLVRAGELLLF